MKISNSNSQSFGRFETNIPKFIKAEDPNFPLLHIRINALKRKKAIELANITKGCETTLNAVIDKNGLIKRLFVTTRNKEFSIKSFIIESLDKIKCGKSKFEKDITPNDFKHGEEGFLRAIRKSVTLYANSVGLKQQSNPHKR